MVLLVGLVLRLAAFSAVSDATNEVHEVNGKTYEDFLASAASEEQWVLLDFMAPWCGHCRRLNPVLDEFASKRASVRIGKVDATVHKLLAKKHGVEGYPTLRFRGLSETKFRDYKGARDAAAFELLDQRIRSPPFSVHDDLSNVAQDIAFVISPDAPGEILGLFKRISIDRRHEATFCVVSRGVPTDGVYLKHKDDQLYPYGGEYTFPLLKQWVKKHNVELWSSPLGAGTFRRIGDKRLVTAVVTDPDYPTDFPLMVKRTLPSVREHFAGGELDGVKWSDYVLTFGVGKSNLPHLVVIDLPRKKFWTSTPFATETQLKMFFDDVVSGKARPHYQGIRGFPDRAIAYYKANRPFVILVLLAAVLLTAGTIYFLPPSTPSRFKED